MNDLHACSLKSVFTAWSYRRLVSSMIGIQGDKRHCPAPVIDTALDISKVVKTVQKEHTTFIIKLIRGFA